MVTTVSGLDPAAFKTPLRGKLLDLFFINNSTGAEAAFSNYGRPSTGKSTDIVLRLPNIAEYIAEETYIGATIGRYSNRIANGKFTPMARSTWADELRSE
jgi:aldose 1-epimerase